MFRAAWIKQLLHEQRASSAAETAVVATAAVCRDIFGQKKSWQCWSKCRMRHNRRTCSTYCSDWDSYIWVKYLWLVRWSADIIGIWLRGEMREKREREEKHINKQGDKEGGRRIHQLKWGQIALTLINPTWRNIKDMHTNDVSNHGIRRSQSS